VNLWMCVVVRVVLDPKICDVMVCSTPHSSPAA
jgi:hypothetical protein